MLQTRILSIGPAAGGGTVVRLVNIKDQPVTRVLPLQPNDFLRALDEYHAGALIQKAFPTLNESEREFLLTGLSDAEWDAMYAEDES